MQNKTYYFGEVDLEEFEAVDRQDLFQHHGRYYWFKIVLEEDQIRIEDSCNRYVPIGFDSLVEFADIVGYLGEIREIQEQADCRIEGILRQLNDRRG